MGRGSAGAGARAAGQRASAPPPQVTPKVPDREVPGKSNARVRYINDYQTDWERALVDNRIIAVFGRRLTNREIASLVGAPDNSVVTKGEGWASNQKSFELGIQSTQMSAGRTIKVNTRGEIVIHNDIFVAHDQGKGLGTKVFSAQVRQAAKLGVSKIETLAAKSSSYNGYYTWARLGYDAKIPSAVMRKLPANLSRATKVSDLMRSESGRKFWKDKGVAVQMNFDLSRGSTSRRTLAAYLRERRTR